ncbi:voltage-gated chloride channel family protein [Taibaiella lutea]|uniref:Voltage-gated chloride channel family protein n=1 Tax=Taibaiella lutea TaxID=2608001 RepID=A0A5M6CPC4_9BACT|nr:voltage-gated chloride channel family protein [Taibaiella lutea]KAA5537098.1 voltage-gated chloride channel family protein [Taibaiella lutea]
MFSKKSTTNYFSILIHLLKWTLIAFPVAALVGSVVALFLWLLDVVTNFRFTHGWLLYLLPLAGLLIWWLYKTAGKNAESGNNMILDEIHQPGGGIPLRMAPLVLITTIITHLFGGSAGREGTAVQIGGSLSSLIGKRLKLSTDETKLLLMMGVAAGFGAVFGTPLTGAIFALEVVYIGRMNYKALLPCLIASFLADMICSMWHIHHTQYHIQIVESLKSSTSIFHFDLLLIGEVIIGGALFGITSLLFSEFTHTVKSYSKEWIKVPWLIPVIGGGIVILLAFLLGTNDYLGLGVSNPDPNAVSILNCFKAGGADTWSWLWKLIFTGITLGMGFKGGEVTPLFFIGAALGNTLGTLCGAPVDLMAGLGFIAVFAGATNTPIACTLMGIELFGGEYALYYAIACFTAYYFSGHTGIYTAQRVINKKGGMQDEAEIQTLGDIRSRRINNRKK